MHGCSCTNPKHQGGPISIPGSSPCTHCSMSPPCSSLPPSHSPRAPPRCLFVAPPCFPPARCSCAIPASKRLRLARACCVVLAQMPAPVSQLFSKVLGPFLITPTPQVRLLLLCLLVYLARLLLLCLLLCVPAGLPSTPSCCPPCSWYSCVCQLGVPIICLARWTYLVLPYALCLPAYLPT